jgi:hypothetical protein
MVTWLRRLFVKDYQKVDDEKVRAAHGKLAAWFGIITNFIIAGMKLSDRHYPVGSVQLEHSSDGPCRRRREQLLGYGHFCCHPDWF